ncbi:hypothetical protein GF337_09075, partial [candidate division KSB1 bacterium]|nr:hypothetical protein [candidate division KSB1 bacterium]
MSALKRLVILSLWCAITSGFHTGYSQMAVTETEYLHSPQVSVLVYHNSYPVGKQGGIEIILHDKRIATNGDLHLQLKQSDRESEIMAQPIPPIENPERIVDRGSNRIKVLYSHEEIDLRYHLVIQPLENSDFEIIVNFEEPFDTSSIDELSFQMEFYPEYYKGKSYITNRISGVFPHILTSDVKEKNGSSVLSALASGRKMIFAEESPEFNISIESRGNPMELIDRRQVALREWFAIKVDADLSKARNSIHLV